MFWAGGHGVSPRFLLQPPLRTWAACLAVEFYFYLFAVLGCERSLIFVRQSLPLALLALLNFLITFMLLVLLVLGPPWPIKPVPSVSFTFLTGLVWSAYLADSSGFRAYYVLIAFLVIFFYFYPCWGDQTQGLLHARQVLH